MTNRVKASDTPETDAAIAEASDPDGALEVCDLCERLERERDEARAKIKRQSERIFYLESATNHACETPLSVALRERDEWKEEANQMIAFAHGATRDAGQAMKERNEARAEVERLREALPFLQAVVSALESDPTNEVEFTVGSLGIEHEGSIRKAIAAKEETK